MQAVDRVECVLETHAVGKCALAFLELLDSRLGVDAVIAVGLAAGEAEDVEALLKLEHICPVEVGQAQVERAVSHLIARVHKRRPGLGVDLAAEVHPLVQTETRDRGRR